MHLHNVRMPHSGSGKHLCALSSFGFGGRLTWQNLQDMASIVAILWRGVVMLVTLVVSVILLSVADIWLLVSTISSQYLQIQPNCSDYDFAPGTGLPPSYLDTTEQKPCGCFSNSGNFGDGGKPFNHSECRRTAAKELTVNRVHILDGQIIPGPATSPPNLEFQASTFSSSAVVIQKSGSHFRGRDRSDDAERDFGNSGDTTIPRLNLIVQGYFLELTNSICNTSGSDETTSSNSNILVSLSSQCEIRNGVLQPL